MYLKIRSIQFLSIFSFFALYQITKTKLLQSKHKTLIIIMFVFQYITVSTRINYKHGLALIKKCLDKSVA